MLAVQPKQTRSLHTEDGVRLDADVYYPDAPGPFPVLLMRQPYGRAIASTVVYAHPSWYAAHGYIVVIQDVRGRGTSTGQFQLFAHEIADGEATVNWAAALPGSTGQVGMYGFSYQGMTQLYAAVRRPPALKTLCPAMIGYDLYADWAYEGGAFCWQANLGWAVQLATETARLKGDEAAYQALFAASRSLPLTNPIPANPQILQDLAPDSFYHDWLHHSEPDAYWAELSPSHLLAAVDLPMLHIGGWFDTFLRGTLNLYSAMVAQSCQPQSLIVGPWAHLPWGRKVGAVDYGPEAVNPVDRLQIRWFDQFLKGLDTGLLQEPPVRLFELGRNQWRYQADWTDRADTLLYLKSTGLASLNEQEGHLDTGLPDACPPEVVVHDPWRPVPALGGHAAFPPGSFDRSSLDCRTDVVTYTSLPLSADLHLLGTPILTLYCSADAPSFDLSAVLSDVNPDGSVYNICQGYVRVRSGDRPDPLTIQLQSTCALIPAGHALRLSLSPACYPAYPVNSGTGALPASERLMDQRIITLTIQAGDRYPSALQLPTA